MVIARSDVRFKPLASLSSPDARYKGLNPGTTVLRAGTRQEKGALRLPCDIVFERDVALTLRDGVRIYADIYRPDNQGAIPAIVNWAPYGKGGTGYQRLDRYPNRIGIAKSRLSGLQSWEGNDPAYWCANGYAVVQVDARGAFNSEGDVHALGNGEGRDGADVVELIAAMDWCTGKIGLAGNSYLAAVQWFIAAQRPPHLAAIAPWEGAYDVYRQMLGRGGIPRVTFANLISATLYGRGSVEDAVAMLEERPRFDEYWADKVPDLAQIDVPASVVASYTNQLHADGTIRGWASLTGPKWLRVHNTMEWPDFYEDKNVEDLRRFFDRYLREVDNGWERTPPVRLSVLDPGHADTVDRPSTSFPPEDTTALTLYLDASTGTLSPHAVGEEAVAGCDLASENPWVDFVHRFDEDVELFGWPMATLWVAPIDHDDGDVYVYIQKLDSRGRELWHQILDLGLPLARRWMPLLRRAGVKALAPAFFTGTDGSVRLSLRGLDPDAPAGQPDLNLRDETPLRSGDVVEVEIPLWPIGMRWHRGEQLRVRISGRNLVPPAVPGLPPEPTQAGSRHEIHTGGDRPSRLTVQVAPARP
jgi:hypothetical protein